MPRPPQAPLAAGTSGFRLLPASGPNLGSRRDGAGPGRTGKPPGPPRDPRPLTPATRHNRAGASGPGELLELLRENWRARAACRHVDPDVFFPESHGKTRMRATWRAKMICASCPVRVECLEFALAHHPEDGIWAGTTKSTRGSMLAARRRAETETL